MSSATIADSTDRFEFGANWRRFLESVNEDRIAAAITSLQQMLHLERLDGKTFLDVGCGSGLFSLAAHRLGATVYSFDYDLHSVNCTREMQRRFGVAGTHWTIEQGSALDAEYLAGLVTADIVYSWGVLHHTGDMWRAIELVSHKVASGGMFFLSIYNDQGPTTLRWIAVKRLYQRLPGFLRTLLVLAIGALLILRRMGAMLMSLLLRILTLRNPLTPLQSFAQDVRKRDARGMHRWYDLVDWVGGWPFEVAKPEEIFRFLRDRGFVLLELKTCGAGMGCNEFVLRRVNP
jgi:2-polyprenyl-6-hydroxyphenyl methylase/3-demethylubiquinone-9 3-methyltransferase